MARRSDHTREEQREMVINIAERMIAEEGISGLSARKIANEMGYTVGTIYLIFKNIDEVITEVNLRTLRQLEAEITTRTKKAGSSEEEIAIVARSYLAYAQRCSKRWRAVFDHQLPDGERFPDYYHQQVAALFSLLESPLRAIRGDDHSRVIRESRALWAAVHGLAMLTLGEKLNPADAAPEEILDLILAPIVGADTNGGKS